MTKGIFLKIILLSIHYITAGTVAQASPFVHGRIYLKDGTVVACTEDDRIKLPKRMRPAKFLKDAYTAAEEKQKFQVSDIDSILAWSPATPEHVR